MACADVFMTHASPKFRSQALMPSAFSPADSNPKYNISNINFRVHILPCTEFIAAGYAVRRRTPHRNLLKG